MAPLIDPEDASRVLTDEQLSRGASGIEYRDQQLVYVTLFGGFPTPDKITRLALQNARIDSALVHGRALAYFLGPKHRDRRYLHAADYSESAWREACSGMTNVAGRIIGAASEHLAHASVGSEGYEPHPGAWPLYEIAIVLSRGLYDFLEVMRRDRPEVADLFGDPPRAEVEQIISPFLPAPTPRSEHPTIGALTDALQQYLDWHPSS